MCVRGSHKFWPTLPQNQEPQEPKPSGFSVNWPVAPGRDQIKSPPLATLFITILSFSLPVNWRENEFETLRKPYVYAVCRTCGVSVRCSKTPAPFVSHLTDQDASGMKWLFQPLLLLIAQ